MKVLLKRFHLNSHAAGFRPQIQKLELVYETLSFIVAVKGLILVQYNLQSVKGLNSGVIS